MGKLILEDSRGRVREFEILTERRQVKTGEVVHTISRNGVIQGHAVELKKDGPVKRFLNSSGKER